MSRKQLLTDLEDYQSRWPAEAETIKRFSDFVFENPDCFERSLEIGHITASAWIVSDCRNQVLLTHHRKLEKWFQLGGHADGQQETVKVALDEAREESGIEDFRILQDSIFDIDIHLIPARKKESAHYHYDVRYLLQPIDSHETNISEESLDLQWIDLKDIQKFTTEESMLRMARKWSNTSG